MLAIATAAQKDDWAQHINAHVAAVISNRPAAGGLAAAAGMGIATAVVDHQQFETRAAFDAALQRRIDHYHPTLVVLAGFMRILTPTYVAHYAGRCKFLFARSGLVGGRFVFRLRKAHYGC